MAPRSPIPSKISPSAQREKTSPNRVATPPLIERVDRLWQNWAMKPERIELAARLLHASIDAWASPTSLFDQFVKRTRHLAAPSQLQSSDVFEKKDAPP